VRAAYRYPRIRQATTRSTAEISPIGSRHSVSYGNSNRLLRFPDERWDIAVSKTGFLDEAGRCLVMLTRIDRQPIVMVMLNGRERQAPIRDANNIRRWVEKGISTARAQLARR
jgi:D-alanyl-D-alanine endopeptidase (penicillin-binding protein 7)